MGFNFVRLVITVSSENCSQIVMALPYMGLSFAELCRTGSCGFLNRDCTVCSHQQQCGWHSVFGQKLSSDIVALRRYQKPSLPFVFTFPWLDRRSTTGNEFNCELVAFGPAITHLPLLLKGFSEMLAHGVENVTARIMSVACQDFQGNVQETLSYNKVLLLTDKSVRSGLTIATSDDVVDSCAWDTSEITLRFKTPLKLVEDGRSLTRFDFARFARSVMRRVSSISYYYGECEYDWDYKELTSLIDKVICVENNFSYAKEPRKTSGITGFGRFIGEFDSLSPLLKLGSIVHTGKGAAFGMGAYEINT